MVVESKVEFSKEYMLGEIDMRYLLEHLPCPEIRPSKGDVW